MGHTEYWVAISHEGTLLGGGLLVTRSCALTSTACLGGRRPGDPVDVHTAQGDLLPGRVDEVADDVGLALICVLPDPHVDCATPRADQVVKGDSWHAPFRPAVTAAYLDGTVDEVAHDRRNGDGRAVSVLELASSRPVAEYDGYAGGPVERRTDVAEPALLGVVLDSEAAALLRDGTEGELAACAIDSAFGLFRALSARALLGALREGPWYLPDAAPAPRRPAERRRPETGPLPDEGLARSLAATRHVLSEFKDMADEGLVDPLYVSPMQVRLMEWVVRTAQGEEEAL
ncbi:hypothetical protein [Streptomyces sp. B93]|uniref:hypothetical protein n=1 Tax=Streptomyces sp. B93 TaxID=2824875 RepID=UPI001B38833E|nr:hypothetical protein [Streptomyces sp. B93]MBQ1093532.1 hypothetical protein [Streptomyces sp. B93]